MIDRIANPPVGMLRPGGGAVYLAGGYPRVERHCIYLGMRGAVFEVAYQVVSADGDYHRVDALDEAPALDLTSATGRAHLAAWITTHSPGFAAAPDHLRPGYLLPGEPALLRKAMELRDMTPAEIDTLARLGLRVMGRAQ